MRASIAILLTCCATAACEDGGTSTAEVERAAIERVREQANLGPEIPLKATVWVGQPHEDQVTVCSTVAGEGNTRVRPQRFAATADPIRWLVMEDAHDTMVRSQPDKFVEWSAVCSKDG